MCWFFKRKKQKEINLVLAGEELELFTRTLKNEVNRINVKSNHSVIELASYDVATRYYSLSRFESQSHVLTLSFSKKDKNDMLNLIVMLMLEADKEEDPTTKLKLKMIAQRIQEIHKLLGECNV